MSRKSPKLVGSPVYKQIMVVAKMRAYQNMIANFRQSWNEEDYLMFSHKLNELLEEAKVNGTSI